MEFPITPPLAKSIGPKKFLNLAKSTPCVAPHGFDDSLGSGMDCYDPIKSGFPFARLRLQFVIEGEGFVHTDSESFGLFVVNRPGALDL